MTKVRSQAGNSLADIYEVGGSIAGIDELETRELGIIHEMGATVFSERLAGVIVRSETGDINQSVTFDNVITGFGANVVRILGLLVFTDNAARFDEITVSVRDPIAGRETPIFAWDVNEAGVSIRLQDDGAAVATYTGLANSLDITTLPSMLIDQRQPVSEVAFRGRTPAFGAGTVFARLLLYTAFAEIRGYESRGLPLPSW